MKSATSEKQRSAVVSVSSKTSKGSLASYQVISAGDTRPLKTVIREGSSYFQPNI